jgi:TfoX/Sxy family transcriptional regulator of competence genes
MAYDEQLAERARELISARADVSEMKMFGGIAFLVGGNMAVGVRGDELLVRLSEEDAERALAEDGVGPFEMGSRRQPKGWVQVAPERLADDASLAEWVDIGADFAASLPPKKK